uniref:NB-ARC domain-containing protein n=1 Tax=Triticum urartu TaxID=4572 RepID=A0A8R7JVB7_TRIUA
MEGLPLVCYSTGTINSLQDKLTKLKNHSNPTEEFSDLTENLKKAVQSLKEDFCDKLGVPTVCMKQAIGAVFEIEDWIDQKLRPTRLDPSDTKTIYFTTEITEACERFNMYGIFSRSAHEPGLDVGHCKITITLRLPIEEKSCRLYSRMAKRDVKHLTDDKERYERWYLSSGMEGLGKTTLAKEIYSELQLGVPSFVSVGRRPAMREILIDILRQVKPWSEIFRCGVKDVEEIITKLREYLSTKR